MQHISWKHHIKHLFYEKLFPRIFFCPFGNLQTLLYGFQIRNFCERYDKTFVWFSILEKFIQFSVKIFN
jgi:hypothetical protein